MCLAARLSALAGMQGLVLPARFWQGWNRGDTWGSAGPCKEGRVWPDVQPGAENVTRTEPATSTPSSVLQQDRSWPWGSAGSRGSFLYDFLLCF